LEKLREDSRVCEGAEKVGSCGLDGGMCISRLRVAMRGSGVRDDPMSMFGELVEKEVMQENLCLDEGHGIASKSFLLNLEMSENSE
jgi:hypothetical protein